MITAICKGIDIPLFWKLLRINLQIIDLGLTHFLKLTVLKELLVLDYQEFIKITFFQKCYF